jgi:hypothetical protein
MAKDNNKTKLTPSTPKPRKMLQMLMYISLLALALVIIFRFAGNQFGWGGYTSVPKEVQIQYVPSDFKPEIDEENALVILSNPYRYSREFDQLVFQFNMSLLGHVANRMGIADSLKQQIQVKYQEHHPYLKRMYFNDFVALRDTSSQFYDDWYSNNMTDAVTILNEVASKYTCYLVNHVISSLLETTNGRISVAGKNVDTPCGVAVMEGLKPMIDRLKERAAIEDFSRSKGMLEERVERVTAELATMEIRDRKGLNKQLQTKVFGFNVSSTEMEISAISVMKIGFDLQKYFNIDMNSSKKRVRVTLPEPEILSHEVYPRIDKLDIGWLRELKDVDFNENFNVLRKEFRREALASDIMDKAKTQAEEIMETMLGPVIKSFDKRYELEIRFKNVSPEYVDDFSTELSEQM